MRISVLAALVCSGLALPAHAQEQAAALPVGIVVANRAPVAKTAEFVGRVEATNRVEIKARVTGYLESVDFKEGDVSRKARRFIASRRTSSRRR